MSDDSLTVLTQSYNPVSFTTEGMQRKNDGLFYKARKVCEPATAMSLSL